MLLNEGMFLCPFLGICDGAVEKDGGVMVVVVVGEPPSDGEFHMWCFQAAKLLELSLSVEFPFVDALALKDCPS